MKLITTKTTALTGVSIVEVTEAVVTVAVETAKAAIPTTGCSSNKYGNDISSSNEATANEISEINITMNNKNNTLDLSSKQNKTALQHRPYKQRADTDSGMDGH